jgi:hypothetical protein
LIKAAHHGLPYRVLNPLPTLRFALPCLSALCLGAYTIHSGADVAASVDLTGAAALGGDWDLEYSQGDIEKEVAFSKEIQQIWTAILANEAPTTANNTVSTSEDVPYVLTTADFLFADTDIGDALQQVQITSLENIGNFRLGGVDVVLDQVIMRAQIDAGD